MDSRSFGRARLTLPDFDQPGPYLANVTSLESSRGSVQEFLYADADLRALELADTQLITGRITGLRAARVQLQSLNLHSVEFDACNLGTAQWADSKLSRVVFRNCKVMGATFDGLALDEVLFENCKLDYTAFAKVRVTGPLAFSKCALSEASFTDCDLTDAVFSDCTLRLTEFGRGRYQGLDLRGNDLSTVRGVHRLAKVLIDRAQQADMAEALLAELDVTYGDDFEER
ncbi:pentapeptide repeat-containing protein [Streptomyces sp. NBC_01481]|uniref:pentapeptide repeat-containing protein n=1 Tax=Streptomyces sp. NBC_01481 TaxID=2975869 RepID=UPI00224E4597|nr:pentapeptide repeat-containing protein [Streptomyces sp. NBC_01481]MCX4582535.1 pentapeptide repeat-containing protein [Streptomyces sp. NBC_01481]